MPRARANADRLKKRGSANEDALQALAVQIGGVAPEGLRQLEPEQLRDLAKAIADKRHRNNAALAAGGERALGMIPRLLRGPIRRVVG